MNSPTASMFDLRGRVAAVTGGNAGIGRAMAEALSAAGSAVVLVARREAELEKTADAIRASGGAAGYVSADLSDINTLSSVASRCADVYGPVDIVVNAAGVNLRQTVEDVTLDSWRLTLDLNLAAPFFFSRAFVEGMRERQYGRIINIASLQSSRAFPNGLAYGASKGGVTQLTRAMAEAWSRFGIMCNAIAPGFFPTDLTAPVFSNPDTERWAASQTTVGRNGRLEDLHGVTVFFASAACNYVTGQTLHVDGGFTAR